MGACSFEAWGHGINAKEAFTQVVEEALYEEGHGGYTGTVAEKTAFTMVGTVATVKEARELCGKLMDDEDCRIQDKWGPAGCIAVKDSDTFLFFGYASS